MNRPQAMRSDKATGRGRPTVLQVLPGMGPGGAERGAIQVAAALIAAGGQAVVASAGGARLHELERTGARHALLPVDSKNPLVMRRNVGRLVALARECGADIIHARSRAPAWSALRAARALGLPFVTTFHGTYGAGSALKRRYNRIMLQGDRVIAISPFIARHIHETYGDDGARIRVVPRGIDTAIFDPAAVTRQRIISLATRLRLPDDLPMVLLPGRLTRWKGQTVLIDALERLGRRDLCAVIMGDDQGRAGYRRELEAQARAAGLETVVRFAPHEADMPAALMLADVVVSASTDPEAFGRVPVEAQAMGRPVIATAHGGAAETVLVGDTGWLVPPGDPQALADVLGRALDIDAGDRARMAGRGRAHVLENWTVEAMCGGVLAVYDELLGVDPAVDQETPAVDDGATADPGEAPPADPAVDREAPADPDVATAAAWHDA